MLASGLHSSKSASNIRCGQAELAFINAGSGDDLPADNPFLRTALTLQPKETRSSLLFAPAGNSTSSGACAADPAALWAATVKTWEGRAREWGSVSIPDPKLARAAEICQQTLLMMTETQHDGLRGLVRRPSVSVVSSLSPSVPLFFSPSSLSVDLCLPRSLR